MFRGGEGLVREIEFKEGLEVSILSERRVHAPYGIDGGGNGGRGENLLIKEDGRMLNLGGKNGVTVEKGDRIRISTPGGGGYGIINESH